MSVSVVQKKFEETCKQCGSKLTFYSSDLTRFTGGCSRRHPDGIAPYFGVKCPCCGNVIRVYVDATLSAFDKLAAMRPKKPIPGRVISRFEK